MTAVAERQRPLTDSPKERTLAPTVKDEGSFLFTSPTGGILEIRDASRLPQVSFKNGFSLQIPKGEYATLKTDSTIAIHLLTDREEKKGVVVVDTGEVSVNGSVGIDKARKVMVAGDTAEVIVDFGEEAQGVALELQGRAAATFKGGDKIPPAAVLSSLVSSGKGNWVNNYRVDGVHLDTLREGELDRNRNRRDPREKSPYQVLQASLEAARGSIPAEERTSQSPSSEYARAQELLALQERGSAQVVFDSSEARSLPSTPFAAFASK